MIYRILIGVVVGAATGLGVYGLLCIPESLLRRRQTAGCGCGCGVLNDVDDDE